MATTIWLFREALAKAGLPSMHRTIRPLIECSQYASKGRAIAAFQASKLDFVLARGLRGFVEANIPRITKELHLPGIHAGTVTVAA